IDEIVDSVLKLPYGGHYHLISTGHPLATYIAYETFRQRGDTVSILFFDGRTKSYLAARDLAKQVRESIKKKGGEKKQ
ncbi:MAG: hypothetical protein QME47_07400, partial [Candidatus Thermoplasmatota archaeon]|nr:hypothetical protein [Candidatus Thermoplasmatota archaeon]